MILDKSRFFLPTTLSLSQNVQGIKMSWKYEMKMLEYTSLYSSVTRSGDFLDFEQLFKAFGNN